MKVIIPVAGEGKRLRPFTFTKPKPLLPVAGKPMINHIMDAILPLRPSEFVFIVGHLGHMMQEHIERTYGSVAKLHFVEQKEINGPGGAVWLAKDYLDEDVLIDYGDTLFDADLSIIKECEDDGIIWSLHVEDPRRFGVIVTDRDGYMTRMVEKPQTFISNLVNIGLYYIKDVALFKEGLKHAIDNKQPGREVYLTEVFSYMIERGAKLRVVPCPGWFDCGTAEALLDANRVMLPKHHEHSHGGSNTIIPPVNIHPTARLENCIIGPHVTVMANVQAKQAIMSDCILDSQAVVEDIMLKEMIVGEGMTLKGIRPLQNNSP